LRYFSTPLELEASIFIQALSLPEAQSKLCTVMSKSIDTGDMRWFTNVPFGSRYLPELSFGTEWEVRHLQPVEALEEVGGYELWHLVRSRDENAKHRVLPTSRDWFGDGKLPIYGAFVFIQATCYIKATSFEAAQVFATHLKGKRLNRYEDERIFWDGAFLGPSQIVLSPNMLVASVSEQQPLKLIYMSDPRAASSNWPDGSGARNLEQHSVAADVRRFLGRMDNGFNLMADDDAYNIAALLIDYRDKAVGDAHTLGTVE